jgi:peptide/nickel transport system substrate-binding protein
MKGKKTLAAAAVTAALSLGLAACGGGTGGGGGGSQATSGGGSTAANAQFNDASTKIVNPSDKKGGTLKFVLSDAPDSVDPGNTYYAYMWDFTRLYVRPLMGYKQVPGAEGQVPVPDLAEAPGQVSSDGLTWTYKIKKGIKYEDGTEVKAQDVKYAIARSNYTDELTEGPKYFQQYLDAKGYKGPYKDKNPADFKGIDTPDDYTLVFHLTQAFSEFDFLLANPQAAPVPAAKDTGLKYQEHPMATGPYMVQNHTVGQSLTLVRNPNWDQSTDPLRKGLPDQIQVQFKVDANDIDNRLMSGAADVDLAGTGVQTQGRASILQDPAKKNMADNPTTGFLRYAMLSTKVKPLDNIDCRKAVLQAADKVSIQAAWGGDIGGQIAHTVLPPSVLGYKDYGNLIPSGADNKGDGAKAKESLTACGQPNGFSINIGVRGDRPKEVASAEAIQQSLAKVGIKTEIKKYPAGDWSSQYGGKPDFVHKNNLGILIAGWGPDWASGFGFLSQIVDGRAVKPSGNYNMMEINDQSVNKLLDEGIKTTDVSARNAVWAQVDQKVYEQAAILPFIYEKALLFRPAKVTNVLVHDAFGMYDYTALGVSG